jgi:hypothetical protein
MWVETGNLETGNPETGVPPDPDEDQDGFAASEDCDDTNDAIHPDAIEICNELDDDCDDLVDDDDPDLDLSTTTAWYFDGDFDGYGLEDEVALSCQAPEGYIRENPGGFDCDDADASTHPGAEEPDCTDPIDHNCDGSVAYADADEDGFAACVECDDDNPDVNPDAAEVCNGFDDDCDELVDDEDGDVDRSTMSTWYADEDGDGFGDESSPSLACDEPAGHIGSDQDCDDDDFDVNPDATELCQNDIDENCDGVYSEGCTSIFLDCGGDGAMDVGETFHCTIGSTVPVDLIYISVGCNDGETGSFSIDFDDGSTETVTGSCKGSHTITSRLINDLSITMNSGGGSDEHISFVSSGGWGVHYK